jgi:hypothetical protein
VDAAACDPSEAAQQAALHALGVACQHHSLVSLVSAELLHRGVRTMQRSHLARFWSGVSAAEAAGAGDQLETSLLQALQVSGSGTRRAAQGAAGARWPPAAAAQRQRRLLAAAGPLQSS